MTVGLVLTWLGVGLRCYTRLFVSRTFGADDYCVIIALVGYTITALFVYLSVHSGAGLHSNELDFNGLVNGVKCKFCYDYPAPGGPRSGSWRGYKKHPSGSNKPNGSPQSDALESPRDNVRCSDLEVEQSWSGKNEEGIWRGADEDNGENENVDGGANEGRREKENEGFELVSRPDGRIVRRTDIRMDYDEQRISYMGREMV
ncbi:hypothetical protein SS1G_08332 [Sclerotinia sclerotiorum 1980 UF-70]|uniref:Rhodopsin domain-containing protein n=1 Tax=Sclerotinia sclerotiorum (strain ATCC 18683 / 1980 / Ss-1) TaxID=665079 RepID=A7ESM7_SCLS1|nr:hypothetical protein SS1G_08332 [Sclerotinia sclerotiorum 1980 UF-70]EDN92469.1 hypothetical protein SS1G_08332 [Sclerotinia sclerotiorum 1980 UF-70]